jgi:hypothetical protein
MKRYLLVAHYTGDKKPLWDALRAAADDGSTFHVVVPATPPPTNEWTWSEEEAYRIARGRLEETLSQMQAAGLDATGDVVNYSVQEAIEESLKQATYDELIISTPPEGKARRSFVEYEQRVRRFSNIPLKHIVNDHAVEIERA